MEFSGQLASFPAASLLQWARDERRSGALVVRRDGKSKRVSLRRGAVLGCSSSDPAEYYGRYLLLHGYLEPASLIEALYLCERRGKKLGASLRELGFLPLVTIQETLRRQIQDAVCDLFLWPQGVFFFETGEPPAEELLPEPIDTTELVLEGTHWLDRYALIRQVLVHDEIVLGAGPRWPGDSLSPFEERVARSAREPHSLKELHRRTGGVYFRFFEAAYDLIRRQVLEIAQVSAPPEERQARETSFYDLLLEQAANGGPLIGRELVAMPLEILERLYPLWIAKPSERVLRSLPPPVEQLCRQIDGRRPLRLLLAEELEGRRRQLQAIFAELRKRNLSLSSVPVDELEKRLVSGPSRSRGGRRRPG